MFATRVCLTFFRPFFLNLVAAQSLSSEGENSDDDAAGGHAMDGSKVARAGGRSSFSQKNPDQGKWHEPGDALVTLNETAIQQWLH